MTLSKEDLQRVEKLWDEVITPACVQLENETGKPAEAFLEAIIAGIEARVVKKNSWNAFERIWWNNQPQIEDKTMAVSCYSMPVFLPLTGNLVQGNSTTNAMPSIKRSARA
jgi:hypothetical protein